MSGGRHATPVIPRDHPVEINGYSVPLGSCVIHFYYTQSEQLRSLGFLLDGIARREAVVLACTAEAYGTLSDGLGLMGICRSDNGIINVEITPDLPASIDTIAAATRDALGGEQRCFGRVLCDFGSMIGQETIFELEGSLHSALADPNLVSVTQYDGRGFGAPITLEQFQTHALAIVGTAFFRENRHYTPPEAYFRKRAVGGNR